MGRKGRGVLSRRRENNDSMKLCQRTVTPSTTLRLGFPVITGQVELG